MSEQVVWQGNSLILQSLFPFWLGAFRVSVKLLAIWIVNAANLWFSRMAEGYFHRKGFFLLNFIPRIQPDFLSCFYIDPEGIEYRNIDLTSFRYENETSLKRIFAFCKPILCWQIVSLLESAAVIFGFSVAKCIHVVSQLLLSVQYSVTRLYFQKFCFPWLYPLFSLGYQVGHFRVARKSKQLLVLSYEQRFFSYKRYCTIYDNRLSARHM